MSQLLAAVLGRGVLGPHDPFAHADELGLTRGDGCFDATLVFAADAGPRNVLHLDRHLSRLARSAAALDIVCPPENQWRELIDEAVNHPSAPAAESVLKLVLTRGREVYGGGPLAYLTLTPLPESTNRARTEGIDVITLARGTSSDAYRDAPWLLGGVKTLAYAVNMAAHREAVERGVDDALFVASDGYALEAPTAGLIVRIGDELVTTPLGPTGVLASITVETTFEACRAAGIPTTYRLLTPTEIVASDGAWLASSGRGVSAIRTLDGQQVRFDAAFHARLGSLAGFPPQGGPASVSARQ